MQEYDVAIYHLNASFVSRSTGRSCVQAAAYLTGEKLHEDRRGLTADYRNRAHDVVYKNTFAPEGAPARLSTLAVWDELETFEDTFASSYFKSEETREKHLSTAQVGQTMVLALPRELSRDSSQELVDYFLKTRFVSRGLITTVAIHDEGDGNPHAHLLISRRAYDLQTESFALKKDRQIVTRYELKTTRKLWAEVTNAILEREGIEARIDHRSYADQGLDLFPTKHKGWYACRLEAQGLPSRIVAENCQIEEANRETILDTPEIILKELSLRQATFTSSDLAKLIQKRFQDDTDLGRAVYTACESEMVEVGIGINGESRYTTKPYKAQEETALHHTQALLDTQSSRVVDQQKLEDKLSASYSFLNEDQRQAVRLFCQESQLGVLVGRAGSGKTTLMKVIAEAHRDTGYQVIGLSLAAKAAENLELETGCPSETIAYYADKWDRLIEAKQRYWSLHPTSEHRLIENTIARLKHYQLTNKHLVIVDEAGMVGTKDWSRVLEAVHGSGAKLIAVGDDHQFKAIEAGDFFRKLKDKADQSGHLATLDTIIRQKELWMREASYNLANLKTYEALAAYENHGLIEAKPRDEVIVRMADAYLHHRETKPQESRLLLAYTRNECALLNDAVRDRLKDQGTIEAEGLSVGGREFCRGDQIVFLKNDRDKKIGAYNPQTGEITNTLVKNGTVGKIIDIENATVTVELTPQTQVRFSTRDYTDINHGYALTLHKSQGQTVDQAFILASKYMDAYSIYVALTRHRFEAKLYCAREDFATFKDLQRGLGRVQDKDLIIDYHKDTLTPEQTRAHDYALLGQDLMTLAQEKEWETFTTLKNERLKIGKEILGAWDEHKEPVRQAGITKESVEIFCGTKERPLSRAEQKAYILGLAYQEKAEEARGLWNEIRKTHPGKQCVTHESYAAFSALRQERDQLAHELVSKPAVLTLAYRASGGELRIPRKTLETQSRSYQEWTARKRDDAVSDKTAYVHSLSKDLVTQDNRISERSSITPDEVKQLLQQRIADLAKDLLGEPSRKGTREWRYGNKGSIAVFVAGTKQGLYSNFETGNHGGGLQMIQDHLSLDYKGAYKWALDWLGERQQSVISRQPPAKELSPVDSRLPAIWTPLIPVPEGVIKPDIEKNPYLSYMAKDKHIVAMHEYKDRTGQLMGYVVRLEDKDGDKITPTLTCCENEKGQKHWRWKGFGENRPLYGLHHLCQNPQKPILVVEGEKTADAAQKLFPDYAVITWPGGSSSVKKADWTPLMGRDIVVWPDNDEGGRKAAHQVAQILQEMNKAGDRPATVKVVDVPEALPIKWDLADPFVPEILSFEQAKDMIAIAPQRQIETLSLSHITDTLKAYGLDSVRPNDTPTTEQVDGIHQTLKQWATLDGKDDSNFTDRAILGAYFQGRAQAGLFYSRGEDALAFALKTQQVGLLAAQTLMAQDRQVCMDVVDLVDRAIGAYTRYEKQNPTLIERYRQAYFQPPERSKDDMKQTDVSKLQIKETLKTYGLDFVKPTHMPTAEQIEGIHQHLKKGAALEETGTNLTHKAILSGYFQKQAQASWGESRGEDPKVFLERTRDVGVIAAQAIMNQDRRVYVNEIDILDRAIGTYHTEQKQQSALIDRYQQDYPQAVEVLAKEMPSPQIKETLEAYGLDFVKPKDRPTAEQVAVIHQELKQWAALDGKEPSNLTNKAILGAYFQKQAQSSWRDPWEDPLESALRTQQVGLIAAQTLMNKDRQTFVDATDLLDRAIGAYTIQQKQKSVLIDAYRQEHAGASQETLIKVAELHIGYLQAQGREPSQEVKAALVESTEQVLQEGDKGSAHKEDTPRLVESQAILAHAAGKDKESAMQTSKELFQQRMTVINQETQLQQQREQERVASRGVEMER